MEHKKEKLKGEYWGDKYNFGNQLQIIFNTWELQRYSRSANFQRIMANSQLKELNWENSVFTLKRY